MSDESRDHAASESRGASGEKDAGLRRRIREQATRFCPPWMTSSLDDVVQTAWLRLKAAAERSERNRDPGPTLIAKVAYCATVDEIRQQRRRREVSMDQEQALHGCAEPDDPARAAVASEIGAAIRSCLATLLLNRRLAVVLYLQGHTAPETAELLGWSLRKTENLVYRGLADMRACLDGKGLKP